MGASLIFHPGHRAGWLEVLDSRPTQIQLDSKEKTHKLWRVWCHYCQSESLVRATSLNTDGKRTNQTCGCRMGGNCGARIRMDSSGACKRIASICHNRASGQIAPFIMKDDPKQLIVTDPEHANYSKSLEIYSSDFLVGVYDEDASSYDIREDYVSLIKQLCLEGKIELWKGLDALESLIYKHRRKSKDSKYHS